MLFSLNLTQLSYMQNKSALGGHCDRVLFAEWYKIFERISED